MHQRSKKNAEYERLQFGERNCFVIGRRYLFIIQEQLFKGLMQLYVSLQALFCT